MAVLEYEKVFLLRGKIIFIFMESECKKKCPFRLWKTCFFLPYQVMFLDVRNTLLLLRIFFIFQILYSKNIKLLLLSHSSVSNDMTSSCVFIFFHTTLSSLGDRSYQSLILFLFMSLYFQKLDIHHKHRG